MTTTFTRSYLPALLVSFALLLSACGGGSSKSGSSGANTDPTPGENTTVDEGVSGPLDLLQEPLSSGVLGQLEAAVGGTPLEGVIDCVDQAVVIDVLDVVDSIALALTQATQGGDPAGALDAAAGNIQFSLNELAKDLPGLLQALTGGDCSGGNTGGGSGNAAGENPLAGTPLEPLGALLAPVLATIGTANSDQDLNLTTLSYLVTSLNTAFQDGLSQSLAQDPTGQIESAPILGGLLTTLSVALNDLDDTMQDVGVYDAEGATEALEITLNNLLVNVLTKVVPISFIEEQTGQEGLFTSQIQNGVDMITEPLTDGLGMVLDPLFAQALEGPLTELLNPIENTLLPALLGPIGDALSGNGSDGAGITGTPLDAILNPLLGPLTSLLGGGAAASSVSGPTGTPLDLLLGPLAGPISGGGIGACPVADTPLSPLCPVVDGLLSALSANPSANPLSILTNLVNTLLGGLLGGIG